MNGPVTEEEALYAQAEAARAEDPVGAVRILEELIVGRPEHPNALNLAGWLLTTQLRDPASFAHGLRLLQRAVELFPDDATPLSNLVESLVVADRASEALAVAAAATQRSPQWREAWNLSGWLKAMKLGRVDEGIADLKKATQLSYWYANAHFNLGRALLIKGEGDAAFEAFRMSTVLGSFRNHEAHLRLGEGHEKAGRLRRSLGAYRQAARIDGRGELTAELHLAINRVGNELLRTGRFFLHAADEHRRFDYLRAHHTVTGLKRIKASTVAAAAQSFEPSAATALILANMNAKALLPQSSDQSAHVLLEDQPSMKRLLDDYFAAWMRLYEALLDAEECGAADEGPEAKVYRLAHERKFGEVAAAIAGWERQSEQGICFRAAMAELAGDLAWLDGEKQHARALYALSEDAFADYASGSSSGGEGISRMVDVNRLRAKLTA